MTRGQYTVNGLALLALTVGLAVYDIRTLGCLLMAHRPRNPWLQPWGTVKACILSAAIGVDIGERNAHNHSER